MAKMTELQESGRSPSWLLAVVVPAAVIAALGVVAWDLLIHKGMWWHLSQPSTIEGGAEALLLLGLLALAAFRRGYWLVLASGLAGALYLRRHNAELTLLAGLFGVEALYAFGCLIRARLGAATRSVEAALIAVVTGVGAWVLVIMLLSAFSLATPGILATLLLVAGTAAIALRGDAMSLQLVRAVRQLPAADRAKAALVFGWLLVLAARTANVVGHDTVWYLGQGDRLLAPEGSIFQSLSLVAPVHYFPKLWEVLLLPWTALDELRPQAGLTIAIYGLLLMAIWQVATRIGIAQRWRWWLLWMLATLPAIANTALTLKSDTLCAFFMAVMCLQLFNWFQHRLPSALAYAAASAALACSTKLTAIPYVGMAVIVLLVNSAWRSFAKPACHGDESGIGCDPPRSAAVTTSLALLAAALLLVRTWHLTGVPTIGPDALLSLWNALGLHIAEPAGTIDWTRPQVWTQVPALFRDWLFAPSTMAKMPISWTGNVWAVLALLALVVSLLGRRPETVRNAPPFGRSLLLALALTGLTLAVVWRYHSRGSDGNYFILPVTFATVLAMKAITSRLGSDTRASRSLALTLLAAGLLHATHSFISAGWSQPGTRPLDMAFAQPPLEPGAWRDRILRRAGLMGIAAHLESRPASERGIGYDPRNEQYHVALPIAMEEIRNIGYSRPQYVRDGDALLTFMDNWNINHLLLPNTDEPAIIGDYRRAALAAGWQTLADEGATLYSRPAIAAPR